MDVYKKALTITEKTQHCYIKQHYLSKRFYKPVFTIFSDFARKNNYKVLTR
jgi:hypothetical protein